MPHKVIILSGPSGSGKTTLYKKLLADRRLAKRLTKTVSFTTRDPRPGEKHGRDYFFISRTMFEYKIRARHFLEYEKVFENYYGTSRKNVKDIFHRTNALLCIDVKGARTVRKYFPKAVSIFIQAPNMGELKKRLAGRGSENSKELFRRIERVKEELTHVGEYGHILVNDNLQDCYRKLARIVAEEIRPGLP